MIQNKGFSYLIYCGQGENLKFDSLKTNNTPVCNHRGWLKRLLNDSIFFLTGIC